MISWPKSFSRFVTTALCVMTSGCFPSSESSLDEQKEPHFLAGKSRVTSYDYKGAVEEFEKALEINPRSASAHLEIGLLFEKNEIDYAAAIYHLERYLRLRRTSEYSEIVTQHIIACKQELAKSVSLAPVTQSMQRDLERLMVENRDLRQKVEAWQAYYAGRNETPNTNRPSQPIESQQSKPQQPREQARPQPRPTEPARTKTHVVKSGEYPITIARKYGVKLDALMAANAGLDPKRLKPGQVLNIPAQ